MEIGSNLQFGKVVSVNSWHLHIKPQKLMENSQEINTQEPRRGQGVLSQAYVCVLQENVNLQMAT